MEYKRDITICVIDMNDSYSRFMCNHEVKLWRETIISIKKKQQPEVIQLYVSMYIQICLILFCLGGFSRCFVFTKISSAVPLIRVLEYCILWLY